MNIVPLLALYLIHNDDCSQQVIVNGVSGNALGVYVYVYVQLNLLIVLFNILSSLPIISLIESQHVDKDPSIPYLIF